MSTTPHLTDITSLPGSEFYQLVNQSLDARTLMERGDTPSWRLDGRLQFNLFFENSTRTNLSFEVAGKRLGAIVSVVPVAASSVHKGESLEDTVLTLAAQGADAIIIRATEPGTISRAIAAVAADRYSTAIINAGEGALGHPTQGLLDVATLLYTLGRRADDGLADQVIAICGDVAHSRVASSAIQAFSRLGAEIRLCGPSTLLPSAMPDGVTVITDHLEEAMRGATAVMGLRLQKERMTAGLGLNDADYHDLFGLTHARLSVAHPDCRVMHPGPMNRGIEITTELADDPSRSLIRSQVTQGVAVRMALLHHLKGR